MVGRCSVFQSCAKLFHGDDDDELPAVVLTGHRGLGRVAYAMTMSVLVLACKQRPQLK